MIRSVSESSADQVIKFCECSPFGVRVAANIMCYGVNMPFAHFWYGEEKGEIVSAISRIDGNMSVCLDSRADMEELAEFIKVIGFKTILCTEKLYNLIGLEKPENLNLLKYVKEPGLCENVELNFFPDLKDIWRIISEVPQFKFVSENYIEWYADMSHKIRHNAARAVMYKNSGTAMTSAETPKTALISAVAVKKDEWGNGRGSLLVRALSQKLASEGKAIFLFCEDKLVNFYLKNGFTVVESDSLAVRESN